jgi:hypothetical protein
MTSHLGEWDPFTQPRTRRELEALIRHAVFVRCPSLKARELQTIAEAVLIGVDRYGLAFRRTAWKPPEDARLETQTLADLPADELHFACGICPRIECHKRRDLMDLFGSFRAAYEVPGLLSRACEERKRHGPNWCRFTYAENVQKVSQRTIKSGVRQSRS